MRFKEISYSKGKILLLTQTQLNLEEYMEQKIQSEEEPRQEFFAALKALVPFTLAICKLETDYDDGLHISGVKFGYEKETGIKGAQILAYKWLDTAPSPMFFKTPYLPECPINQLSACAMPRGLAEALQTLEAEALEYIKGRRYSEQQSLFAESSEFRLKVEAGGNSTLTGAPSLIQANDPFVDPDELEEIESRGY